MRLKTCMICLMMILMTVIAPASFAQEEDWQLDTALELSAQMAVLADNITYVELFVDAQEGLDEELAMMAACKSAKLKQVYRYAYTADESLAASVANYFITERMDDEVNATAEVILSDMNRHLPQLLMNISGGWLWQQISNCLSAAKIVSSDKNAEQGFLFLDYGLTCGVLVTFTQYEGGMLCEAYYVQSELFTTDCAKEWLALLWQEQ